MSALVDNSEITSPATGSSRTDSGFTVPNNPNRIMYVMMASFSSSEPHESHNSVVFNTSESATKIADKLSFSHDYRCTLWRLTNPTATTADIVGTASASCSIALLIVTCRDTDQTTPNGTVATNDGTASEPTTITFDSNSGDLGLNFSLSEYGVSSHGTDQTENALYNTGWGHTSCKKTCGATNTTMTENLTGAGASWVTIGLAVKAAATTQTARPSADVTDAGWVNQTGSNVNLYQSIDETAADDLDYIQSAEDPSNDEVVVQLSSLQTPESGTRTLRYRYNKISDAGTIDLTVGLYVGSSLVQETTHTGISSAFVDGSLTITNSISDYTNLRIRFKANKT
jgi:hypothetical protein